MFAFGYTMAFNMTKEEITAARFSLGLTQAQLAEKIGARQATISDWENGKYPISRPFIKLIEYLLNSKQ